MVLVCGAQVVNGDIVMFSAQCEKRRSALTQLQEQLQGLPSFLNELYAITANIGKCLYSLFSVSKELSRKKSTQCVRMFVSSAHLEGEFEEMESRLVYLETLCSYCDEQAFQQHNISSLETYRKKKRCALLFNTSQSNRKRTNLS